MFMLYFYQSFLSVVAFFLTVDSIEGGQKWEKKWLKAGTTALTTEASEHGAPAITTTPHDIFTVIFTQLFYDNSHQSLPSLYYLRVPKCPVLTPNPNPSMKHAFERAQRWGKLWEPKLNLTWHHRGRYYWRVVDVFQWRVGDCVFIEDICDLHVLHWRNDQVRVSGGVFSSFFW